MGNKCETAKCGKKGVVGYERCTERFCQGSEALPLMLCPSHQHKSTAYGNPVLCATCKAAERVRQTPPAPIPEIKPFVRLQPVYFDDQGNLKSAVEFSELLQFIENQEEQDKFWKKLD